MLANCAKVHCIHDDFFVQKSDINVIVIYVQYSTAKGQESLESQG